ncbi:MAG: hypothetical protein KBS44_04000, partial [Clostridiales bacterium]|nr:hypothetical protein [Candidatus Coliplasma equi]
MKKIIAAALSVLMVVLAIPASVLAIMTPSDYGLGEKEDIIIHASDGDLPYDVAWNEMFPYGTFAFGEIEMNIDENGKERTYIPVYRLGGTNGRATVIIDYSPAAATLDDGSISYAYAASAKTDLRLFVEDDQPIAAYQRLGQDPMEKSPEGIKLEADYDEAAKQYTVSLAGGENTPESYRWQYFNFSFGYWNDIAGGTEETITIDEDYIDGENGYKNEIRLIYVEDGKTFCTPTLIFGVEYDKTEDEAKEIPEGITYIDEPTYTEITLENEYDACAFEMTFADGEWMKRIAVETIDDDVPELDEMGLFTITGCIGGVNTTVCNTLALGVLNDDEYLPSEVGFAVDSVEFDQDGGYAQVSVVRTGCLGYIVSLEYETFDETAKAGEQYAPVSGEITLAGDVDTATINIPLLAESRRESKKSFGIKLKNIRGGGNDGKCVISSDSAEVFLTSSGDAKEKGSVNLATVVVSTGGKDASGNVSVSDGTLIGGGEKVNAEALDPESKLLGGKYVYSNTYDYSDAIKFSRKSIASYDDLKFWQDYEAVTGYPRYEKAGYASLFKNATYEKNSRKPDGNTPREYFNVTDEMIEIGHNDSTITPASITISDAGRLFSRVDWYFHLPVYGIAQWDGDKKLSANDKRYVMPYIEANYKDQSWVGDFDFGFFDLSKNINAPRKFNEYDGFDLDFSNSPFTLDINLVLHKNGQTGKTPTAPSNKCANGCTRLQLEELRMNRRVFGKTGDIGLRIFTANDSDTKGQYTELDTSSEVYSFLRPSVSIVEGAGGVDAKGRLYVGSKLYIQLNSSASYIPYSGEKADETVYLTRRDGTKVAAMVESVGSNFYYLTMLWDDMTLEDIESGEYILNVVVTRKQKISMDLSPSLLRDDDGNVRHDSESYKAALKSLVRRDDGVARKIMVVSSEFSKDEPHFKIVTNVIRADELFANIVGSSAVVNPDSDTRLHNIQSINFDLDAEDIIMFNGRIYAGNETIKLSLADLSAGNLTFRFYDAAYVDSESETAATLSHTELFYDGNGNGKIDGYFDEKIGYFIVDTSSGDYSLGMIDGQISETELDPVIDSDGTIHQYFLKVYYTVTPKSIVPKDDNLLQILPAFITAITDKEKLSLLTEEEKSYRVIQASGTKVLVFDPVTEAYGGIKEIADTSCGHAMYGAEASRMSTLDFPLGGNTRYYLNTTVTDGSGNKSTLDCTDFKGNLRIPYENPSIISKSESGSVNYEVKDVNGYLGAFVDISTFILCVQTQTEISTLDDINPETVAMGNVSTTLKPVDVTDISEDQPGGMEFDTDGDGGSPMKELDIAAKMNLPSFSGSLTSYFNLQTLNRNQIIVSLGIPVASLSYSSKTKSSTDKDGNKVEDSEVVDSQGYKVHTKTTTKTVVDEEGNPQTVNTVETMTTKTTVETLPNGHERTIDETHMKNITDGGKASYFNEVYVVEKWTDDDGEHEKVISDTVNSNPYESTAKTTYWKSKALDDMKNVNTNLADIFSKKLFTEPSQNYKDTKNGTANKFKTFALSFSIKFAALIEYDNLKGEWVFKKAIISATAAISFRFEVRFCPVVYLFIKVSFSVTVAANITFPFKKNKGDTLGAIDYEKIGAKSGSVSTLKEGQWAVLVLDTDTKVDSGTALNGFSMKFKGKVNMYVAEDYTYFSDTKTNSDKFITKGTLSSDGLTDTDVRLDKHTGGKLYVGICARQDTEFTDLRELFVTGRGQAFNDLAITLDLTAEAGIGFDMICFGVEVFFKFNVNAIFQIAGISPVTGKRDSDVTYFSVSLALSISARFLLFSWSMDMIGVYYTVSKPYPHGPATINRGVQAFGKLKPLTASYNS